MWNSKEKLKLSIASLKGALSLCQSSDEPLLNSREDLPATIPDNDEVVVLPIKSRGRAELKEKLMLSKAELPWVNILLMSPNAQQQMNVEEDEDEFVSTKSGITCGSISASREDFLSARISFSSCLSPDQIEFDFLEGRSLKRASIIQELSHCQGWPFGLFRKLALFPPLPKSPTVLFLAERLDNLISCSY